MPTDVIVCVHLTLTKIKQWTENIIHAVIINFTTSPHDT